MSSILQGGCACGAIRYTATEKPLAGVHCQCRACQRSSGTGHTSNMLFHAVCFELEGPLKLWPSLADSGNTVERGFCTECGSPIVSTSSGMPNLVFVRAASLDDPEQFTPTMIIHGASAPEWDAIDSALPHFCIDPDMAIARVAAEAATARAAQS